KREGGASACADQAATAPATVSERGRATMPLGSPREGGTPRLASPDTGLQVRQLDRHAGTHASETILHTRLKSWAALPPLLLSSPLLHAQQSLEPLVVTATRQETRVEEVLADVTVIDR